MKKVKRFLIGNIKTVIAFVLGTLISGVTVYAATVIAASQVGYTPPSGSGISSTNVQGAIDELYTKAASGGLPSFAKTNSAKAIIATSAGMLFKRSNGNIYFISSNNWAVEKDHIQQVFSDISCNVGSSEVSCSASDFRCSVSSRGSVSCDDRSDGSICDVYSSGSAHCF